MIDFETIRVFIDEDYSSDNKFTALGSFYFIHKTQHAFIWNFDGKFLSNRFYFVGLNSKIFFFNIFSR